MTGQQWFERFLELRRHEAAEGGKVDPEAVFDLPEPLRLLHRFLEKHHKKQGPKERADEIAGIQSACALVGENRDFASPILAYESDAWCYIIDESDPSGYYRIPKQADI
jgi:hypothetical protein